MPFILAREGIILTAPMARNRDNLRFSGMAVGKRSIYGKVDDFRDFTRVSPDIDVSNGKLVLNFYDQILLIKYSIYSN